MTSASMQIAKTLEDLAALLLKQATEEAAHGRRVDVAGLFAMACGYIGADSQTAARDFNAIRAVIRAQEHEALFGKPASQPEAQGEWRGAQVADHSITGGV